MAKEKTLQETFRHDTYSYKGWLVSDNIVKRSLAVTGHGLFTVLMIYAFIFVMMALWYVIYVFLLGNTWYG